MITLCINISELDKVELRRRGNRIVDNFNDLPNSLVVPRNKYEDYV